MKIGVFGPGRTSGGERYTNYAYVAQCLDNLESITGIVTGGGTGVEELALRYAQSFSIEHEVIPPNIQAHGKEDAFIQRNREIAKKIDMIVIIWNGRGQQYSRLLALALGMKKEVLIIPME